MKQNKFTLIKGGSSPCDYQNRRFLSAYVTDTRLMGVVGLYIHWELQKDGAPLDQHQFFYFDAEEYGLDSYRAYFGEDPEAISAIEDNLIGGLGGEQVALTQTEAVYLVQDFCRDSLAMNAPLPEPKEEYAFLLQEPIVADATFLAEIARKYCTKLKSDFQLVHYFLMRSFGKDVKGMQLICEQMALECKFIEDISQKNAATLCKNTIEEFTNADGSHSYLCESLVEVDDENSYYLIMSEVTVAGNKVVQAKRRSSFRVTLQEVSMLLARPEFVTVFEILSEPEDAYDAFQKMLSSALETSHENGKLFVVFHKNNEHVNRQIFRLNDDVQSMFYVTDFGQLLVASYSLPGIWEAERKLQKSSLSMLLVPTGKFEFKEPVLFDFIQSDFDDFEEFLEAIRGED